MKYPETAEVNLDFIKDNDGVAIIIKPGAPFSVGSASLFRVEVLDNTENLSLEDFHKEYANGSCNTERGGDCELISFNGYKALKATDPWGLGNEKYAYYIQREKNIFRLRWEQSNKDEELENIGNQILSTFRFLN